jgi:hypothetical protein
VIIEGWTILTALRLHSRSLCNFCSPEQQRIWECELKPSRSLSTGGTMVRFCVPAALMVAHLVLSGCSHRQQIDFAQWREYRSATEATTAELSRPAKTRANSVQTRSSQTMISRAWTARDEVGSAGTVGQTTRTTDAPKHMRPWPKRGSPEFEQLQAEDIEQENRAKAATHSICRGC